MRSLTIPESAHSSVTVFYQVAASGLGACDDVECQEGGGRRSVQGSLRTIDDTPPSLELSRSRAAGLQWIVTTLK